MIDAAFSFTNSPANPTVVVLGHNSSRVALEWEYAASGGEIIGPMRIQRVKNGVPETVATKFSPQSPFSIEANFANDSHFEAEDPATLVINNVTAADEAFVYRCVVQTSKNAGAGHRSDIDLKVYCKFIKSTSEVKVVPC